MKAKSKFNVRVAVLIVLASAAFLHAQAQASMDRDEDKAPISLLLYLNQLGEKHDRYFTIENSWIAADKTQLSGYPVGQGRAEPVLDDELVRLSVAVPNLSFQIDPNNPAIIHAIDKRLSGFPGYSMDQVVADFRLEGTLDKLLTELAGQNISIAADESVPPGDPVSTPFGGGSFIRTSGASQAVRSLLCDLPRLPLYSRVLWSAATERRHGAATSFYFRGKKEYEHRVVHLEPYLRWLGREHDVFFTIEGAWAKGETNNNFSFVAIPTASTKAVLEDELQRLTKIVPNLKIEIDEREPRVIHLIDARLAGVESYSLGRNVRHFEMTGKLPDLVAELTRRGILIAFNNISTGSVALMPDWSTVVHVKTEQSSVRSLLSDSLPLASYSRLLWTATTERRQGALTSVDFKGHRPSREQADAR